MSRDFIKLKILLVAVSYIVSMSGNAYANPPKIGVKFYLLTENKEVNRVFNENQISKIMKNLTASFRDHSGKKLVNFTSLGLSKHKEIKDSKCTLLKYGTQAQKPKKAKMIGNYLSCKDPNLRSLKAINFYIFDSPWQENKKWKTSYAYFDGSSSPALLANWQTLKSGYKTPDIHEMGHIFGLNHTAACGSKDDTPTLAMASETESCKGTGGNRKLGFTKDEVVVIKKVAENLHKILSQ